MKKLIEFQEDKHADVINIIAQFRADNNTTFSEAVRRLVLCSRNGNCPTEPECEETVQPEDFYTLQSQMNDRIETLEKKTEVLVNASKVFKTHMDKMNNHEHLEDGRVIEREHSDEE